MPGDSQFSSDVDIGMYSGTNLRNSGTSSSAALMGRLNSIYNNDNDTVLYFSTTLFLKFFIYFS
jgi:hypothetical protein